jgi:hypothetical protein
MGWSDDYLEHHGILGQKWGVRRFESKNGTLTPAGKNRYNSVDGKYQKLKKKATPNKVETTGEKKKEDTAEPEKKKGLTDKQKKVIIAGAAIAGTALAAYGGYKLYQLNNKAKEGLADDLHKKAVKNIVEGHNMETYGDSLVGPDGVYTPSLQRNYNYDKGISLMKEGAHQRHLGEHQAFRAREKNFTLKEKYDYIKKGKTTDDDHLAKMHRDLADKERVNRAGIEKKYAEQRRQQELEAQKAFRAAQNTNYSTAKPPAGMNAASKMAWKASQSLAKNLTPPGAKTINSGKKTVTNTTKIHGQEKFSQAAKANDDLVNDLLKKNAQMLKGF